MRIQMNVCPGKYSMVYVPATCNGIPCRYREPEKYVAHAQMDPTRIRLIGI